MKKYLIWFVVLFPFAIGFAQNNLRIMESLSMKSEVLNQDIKYSIVLPEEYYSTNKNYPVVYLLHGLGDDETSWLENGRVSQFADEAVKSGKIVPMIFVMPQGFRNYYINDYAKKFMYQDMFIKELVPFIDKQYRTVPNKEHRATMGYSMGGFGAIVLPLLNPEVFTISVPLSISVRTDEQYKTEDASEWNEQWGRLFGGQGSIGQERITDYYMKHSPFHIFAQLDVSKHQNLKLYIDNGDDENTLSRSNEELHILLRNRNFPHEFRVRNGGHEFSYWREALPNGLRYISDAFQGKNYRGDLKTLSKDSNTFKNLKNKIVYNTQYDVFLPEEYKSSNRLYPTLYCVGNLGQQTKEKIALTVQTEIKAGVLAPLIIIFINEKVDIINTIIPSVEKEYRVRTGYRFRALIGFEEGGTTALENALQPEKFTSCVLFDSPIDNDLLKKAIDKNKKQLKRTWFFISTTDKSVNYQTNGNAHLLLREEDVYHEYRVGEGTGESLWFLNNLKETLTFTQQKMHR
ncbi:alpha/beta hydrolase-fold protein [Lutibacter sp.]|uniref:alpha/beta hydrolase-fold protein n=1 Tax=Lutibacter sp. TaxID=1925666 RepID=UPI002734DF8C|nr:alpha/beta hydrolase-fold protein [Lutibacter sp.]MDP3313119.1 alpha/beta hydrolase-fold protein [Lutibacter sp.]